MSQLTNQIREFENKIVAARGRGHLDSLYTKHRVDPNATDIESELKRLGVVTMEAEYLRGQDSVASSNDRPIYNIGKANAEIKRLESLLGIPDRGEKVWQISRANKRIAELRQQLRGAATSKPAAGTPPAPAAEPPKPSIQQIAMAAFGDEHLERITKLFNGDESKINARLDRNLWLAGLAWPGMNVSELTRLYGAQPEKKGFARIERGEQQQRIDALTTASEPTRKSSDDGKKGLARVEAAFARQIKK